ncbi:hypothetical protein GOP47_0028852 [Adiantum capillus-veneris]|nr:hypothetical protein GOP47_0028514 [Adiantum capillus-veneris]KAI5057034.1 hypothetical protein GOP47_0028852 [Adiantum capillus-veneris]
MQECFVLPWLVLQLSLVLTSRVASTADGDALVTMMSKWRVSRPSSWGGEDPCAMGWEGVKCDANAQVSHLNLTNKGLVGEVPTEMGSLEGLVNLDLSNTKNGAGPWNLVSGDLSALSGLSKLQSLNFTFNALSGSFPTVILQFTGLTDLRLDNCNLRGAFPQGLSKLSKLQYLYLGNNSMAGVMPSDLGSLTNLIDLSLWANNFTSTIIAELSGLKNLRYLNLHDCSLFGGLPPEFGNLSNMERMFLYDNALTGPIPETWENMKKIKELRLKGNRLTKSFPSWILDLTNLTIVDLSYNYLYGPISNITSSNLQILNAACNYFSGAQPSANIPNFTDAQNCFGENSDIDNRGICNNGYTCLEFSKSVVTTGSCPDCPPQQTFSSTTTCVCLGESISSVPDGGQSSSHKLGTIIGIVVGVVSISIISLIGCFMFKRYRHSQRKLEDKTNTVNYGQKFKVQESQGYWEAPKGVKKFTLEELAMATSGFDSKNEIGAGGFGKVFYGKLENGKEVAIKRASSASMQGGPQFRNEVELLSRLHHRNLVRLEGFCEDSDLQILVYEYVPNGNLHSHLFQHDTAHSFGWLRRLDIAVGIAQGLDYLHSFADPPVIHRDVKPSNVLLDNNLLAKVADFGISKTTMEFETHISTTPAGTAGYIDPQYFLRRQLTTASDVYGFGVVLLELITGQRAIDPSRLEDHNLVEWVKVKIKLNGIEGIIDPRMKDNCPLPIYETVTRLAISCASFNKNDRPQMKEAVIVLDECLRSSCPPPTSLFEEPPPREYYEAAIRMLENDEGSSNERITVSSTLSASKSAFKGSALLPR